MGRDAVVEEGDCEVRMTLEEDMKKLEQRVTELETKDCLLFEHDRISYSTSEECMSTGGGCCVIGAVILGAAVGIGLLV